MEEIMIHSAIEYFREKYRDEKVIDLDNMVYQLPSANEDKIEKLTTKKVIEAIRHLSPAYRMVFNLFVFEGYNHEAIAEKLNIPVNTSKLDLLNARNQLQKILSKQYNFSFGIMT
jgi:RNA polymerase sigma-70 factor (ECF subfamily)